MHLSLRSISTRTLAFFAMATLIPVVLLSWFLLTTQQTDRKKEAADRQSLLVSTSAERVNNFIGNKIDSLILHSQTTSVQKFDNTQASLELNAFIKQDSNILRVSLVDAKGNEKVVADRQGAVAKKANVATSEPFKVVTFLAGKEYVGPVTFDAQGVPQTTLAVPIVSFVNRQDATTLSTAESGIIRSANDIKGALILTVSLDTLWQSVLSQRLGTTGYAYVVDDKGTLIAHPDNKFVVSHPNLASTQEVQRSLANASASQPTITTSERGTEVLSSHYPVSRTGWIVIGEEPTASVYGPLRAATRASILFGVIALMIGLALSVILSRGLVRPIQKLAAGVTRIGEGDLEYKVEMPTHDELGLLASTVNDMGGRLNKLISELQTQNLSLAAERAKLNAVLNTMSDGVVALDGAGLIVFANTISAKLAAVAEPQQLIGQHWSKAFPLQANGQVINLQKPGAHEAEMVVSDKTKYVKTSAMALNDPSGMSLIVTLHDITPSRELENMKLDFVSIAAHELRTPLTTIRGYLEAVTASKSLTVEDKEMLGRASVGAQTLAALINNLLSVSKLENKRFNVASAPVNWTDVVNEIINDEKLVAADKQIKLDKKISNEPIWISGDVFALKEVLGNLISNAINYSSPNTTITVSIEADDESVTTHVADHGIGIPKDLQGKLFQKFYQANGGLTRSSKGTGLGLYIARSIIELHAGKIWAESQEGKGSTFSFTLHRIAEPSKQTGTITVPKNWGWIKTSAKK